MCIDEHEPAKLWGLKARSLAGLYMVGAYASRREAALRCSLCMAFSALLLGLPRILTLLAFADDDLLFTFDFK